MSWSNSHWLGAAAASELLADDVGTVVLRWFRIVAACGVYGGLTMYALLGLARRPVGAAKLAIGAAQQRVLTVVKMASAVYATVVLANLVTVDVRPADRTTLMFGTTWGHWQLTAITLGIGLTLLSGRLRTAEEWPAGLGSAASAAICGVSLAVADVASGHIAGAATDANLVLAIATVHVLAAGAWLGVLGAIILLRWPPAKFPSGPAGRALAGSLVRFLVASGLIAVASGLLDAGTIVPMAAQLWTSTYGVALLVKVALAAVVAVIAAVMVASLRRPQSGAPRWTASLTATGVGLLLAVAVLAKTSPAPAEPEQQSSSGVQFSAVNADLVVTVGVSPNQPGSNAITVWAASTRRPTPSPIESVVLRISTPTGTRVVMLQAIGDGQFFASAELASAGPTSAEVVINRRSGAVTVAQSWTVAEAPPVPASRGPTTARIVDPVAGVLAAVAFGLALWWLVLSRRRWGIAVVWPVDGTQPPESTDEAPRAVLQEEMK